jgi:hypothetical protein
VSEDAACAIREKDSTIQSLHILLQDTEGAAELDSQLESLRQQVLEANRLVEIKDQQKKNMALTFDHDRQRLEQQTREYLEETDKLRAQVQSNACKCNGLTSSSSPKRVLKPTRHGRTCRHNSHTQ